MGGAIKCTLNAIFDWNDFWSPVVICFSFPFAFLFPSARKERDWDRRAVQTVLVTPITVFGVPFLIWAKVLLHLSACCIYLAFPYSTFLLVVDFILVPSSHDCDVDWETIQGDRERRGKVTATTRTWLRSPSIHQLALFWTASVKRPGRLAPSPDPSSSNPFRIDTAILPATPSSFFSGILFLAAPQFPDAGSCTKYIVYLCPSEISIDRNGFSIPTVE